MKVLQRNKRWLEGCIITESVDQTKKGPVSYRRFTATINGIRNWKIYEGRLYDGVVNDVVNDVVNAVRKIKTLIIAEDKKVFHRKGFWVTNNCQSCKFFNDQIHMIGDGYFDPSGWCIKNGTSCEAVEPIKSEQAACEEFDKKR